ncbi:histidine kinase [Actinomadura kijaniata]|uniref:sensor histidine kinase n=1 Tax=Actinomadura kijaniata TaxID=46161 RepID=UPI003F1E05AF
MNGQVAGKGSWWRERAGAPWRGFRIGLLATPTALLLCALALSLSLVGVGLGVLLVPVVIGVVRALLDTYRDLAFRWAGQRVERPYLPAPSGAEGRWDRFARLMADPATWRDLVWMLGEPVVALFTAQLPALLILYGLWGWILANGVGQELVRHGFSEWYAFVHIGPGYGSPGQVARTLVVATAFLVAGFLSGPSLLRAHGRWAAALLGPTERSRLALRVAHLTETRAEAVDTSAAELRRIERDLHDGAQARLVAVGMSLGAIEHLLEKDPDRARALLAQTRESSARALSELRDLVRGIHPPVLADRGLGDAVRALALDHPLDVEVSADLPGRLPAPVESAAYFAVAELLANAAKHSGARRVRIDLWHAGGTLRVTVTDDGHGGATLEGGTGLRGVERRIATFDGVLALTSPAGGPTVITLELPCASSSPRI